MYKIIYCTGGSSKIRRLHHKVYLLNSWQLRRNLAKHIEFISYIEAKRQRIEGKVILKVFISEKGEVQNIEIAQSSGHDSLDQAAIESVKQWRFIPADVNGKKCAADSEITIVFMLK